jgi:hypothetical protein
MNEQSRDTGNIVYKIENEDKEQNTAQKTKKDFQHAPPPPKKKGEGRLFFATVLTVWYFNLFFILFYNTESFPNLFLIL